MPSCVLLLAAFGAIVRLRDRPTLGGAAWIGLLAGLATLFHESAGLFVVVGAVGIWTLGRDRARVGQLAAYGMAWAGMVLGAYALVGLLALHLHSPGAFHHWMNAYAERGWWWDFHVLRNLRLDGFGLRHAVFVEPLGRAALAETPLGGFGRAALGLIWALYALALLGLTAAAWAIAVSLPRLRRSPDWPLAAICLVWTGLYTAFFTIWCPGAFVFWVPVLVPLGTLLLLAEPRPLPLGVWVGVFAALNFLGGILPYLKPIAGVSQRLAVDIRAHTPPRSLIVVAGVGGDAQCEVDIPYFANRPVLSLHGLLAHSSDLRAASATLDKSLTGAMGAHRHVYVLGEIWDAHDCVKGLQKQSPDLSAAGLRDLFGHYTLTPAWASPRGQVWEITPKPGQASAPSTAAGSA